MKPYKKFFGIAALAFILSAVSAQAETVSQRECCGSSKTVVDVAFVLDTTGSMTNLIEGAKRKIWSIATAIVDANPQATVRMALIGYRDHGDVYVTDTYPLTTDINALYGKLLSYKAKGGGDWPESVNEALHIAITDLNWTEGSRARRLVFLVGDAPPHMDYEQDIPYPDALKIAKRKNIIVNAIQAGLAQDTERVWRSIAQMGNGRYICIPQDGGVIMVETPYDHDIQRLQNRLGETVVPYGTPKQAATVRRKVDWMNSAPAPTASDMAKFNATKSGRKEVVTGEGDLIADAEEGKIKVGEIPTEQLEDSGTLAGMTPKDREAEVAKRIEERKSIRSDLEVLIKKRDGFLTEARKTDSQGADSFDRAIEDLIREQAVPITP
ncbi:MAG: vWA domain-containing protein [Alphaproteobacteria bacterium]